jgi:hypothetical protein
VGSTAAPPPAPDRYLNHPPLIALWTAVPLLVLARGRGGRSAELEAALARSHPGVAAGPDHVIFLLSR